VWIPLDLLGNDRVHREASRIEDTVSGVDDSIAVVGHPRDYRLQAGSPATLAHSAHALGSR